MSKQQPTAQQQAIIKAITTNVAVSAGAGSGKTQVLIGRFMHILESSLQQGLASNGHYPLNVDQMVAITFTKKAAAEMRSRLRHELNAKLEGLEQEAAAGRLDALLKKSYAAFWRTQLERLPRTHISTIHSLCSYILRENPLEANLDPQFTVAEEYEGAVFVQECLKKYVRRSLKEQNEHILALADCYGLTRFMKQLQLLLPWLKEIKAAGDLLQPYKKNLASLDADKEALCGCLRELAEHSDQYQKPASKVYKEALATIAADYVKLAESIKAEPADLQPMWAAFTGVKANKEIMQDIKALAASIELKERDALALPLVEHWQAILDELYAYVQQQKQAVDLLTFDDLEDSAITLLQDYANVRHKYHQRFAHIMVDEFQDTNDKQRELIYLLCGEDRNKLQGQKLFVVGDPKQSIYRFRGADVSVFKRVQQEIAQLKGQCLSMDKNFRSRESILQAVNAIFAPLLGTDTAQDVFFTPLEADIPRMQGGEPVALYTAYYNEENKGQKNLLEAELVVAKILELHHQGIELSDITILLRSMTRLDVLLPALQKYNVPFVLHSGRGFYEEQEVLDLLNLLTVLHNKYRSIELAGCLRSPYFGLDDETLTQLFLEVESDCLWEALMTANLALFKPEQQPLVARAREILQGLRQSASSCGLVELWLDVEQRLSLKAVLSQQSLGAVQLANVEKLGKLIFSFVQEQQGTLASWLAYVTKLREFGTKETVATVEAKSAVQLMTYHSSKGLQFPVVILPFLEGKENSDKDDMTFVAPNRLHSDNSWGLGIKVLQDYTPKDTFLLQQLKTENKRLNYEERKRLLYVAATRAEQQLILFGNAEEEKNYAAADWQQKNWYVQLQSVLPETAAVVRLDAGALTEFLQPLSKEQEQQLDTASALLQPLDSYAAMGSDCFSPSALQSYMHCPRYYFYKYGLHLPGYTEAEPIHEGREVKLDAATLGKVVHSALEYYGKDAYNAKELERCLALAARRYNVGAGAAIEPARAMLEQYLRSELLPPLSRAEKETEFTLRVDGLTLTGVIDCMYANADGSWTLIDYKSGRVPTQEQGKNIGYMYQLALYRLAVEKLFRRRVSKCVLHYLQGPQEVGLEDETEYKRYLAAALAQCQALGKLPSEEAAFPRSCGEQCAYCEFAYMCK